MVEASGESNSPSPDTEELTNTSRETSETAPTHNNNIDINDIEMLENIGVDDGFPLDGNYELTADIDGSSFNKTIGIFKGDLNGRGHTISNIKRHLIYKLKGGAVRNLIISNANLTENEFCFASIACFAEGNSTISNVQIKDSHLYPTKFYPHYTWGGAIVAGLSGSSRIENSILKNCTINTYKWTSRFGCLTGEVGDTSEITNNTINGVSINTEKVGTMSGCLVGLLYSKSLMSNNKVFNCSLVNNGEGSVSGGAAGRLSGGAKIRNVTVSESRVEMNGENSNAGVVLGCAKQVYKGASLSESTAINSIAIVTHESSHAGIWVGQPHKNIKMYSNTAINCTAEAPTSRETSATTPTPTPTANLTTTEPVMVVDDASCWPLGLFLTGATVTATAIGAIYLAGSLYNGFQAGKRGQSLAMHPFRPFGTLLTNCYHLVFPDALPVSTTQEDSPSSGLLSVSTRRFASFVRDGRDASSCVRSALLMGK